MHIKILKFILTAIFKLFPQVSEATAAKRKNICEGCKMHNWDVRGEVWSCGEYLTANNEPDVPLNERSCGCDVDQKTKLRGFKCPQKKW